MDFQLNLSTETVQQIADMNPVLVERNAATREVMRILQDRNTGGALICENQKLVGIFTERDALKLMADPATDFGVPIERYMTESPVTLTIDDTVGTAIARMSQGGYRRLPLVNEQGHAVGMVKVSGILRFLVEHFPKVVYTLPPRPHHNTQEREGA